MLATRSTAPRVRWTPNRSKQLHTSSNQTGRAVTLWTGGKDSALATFRAQAQGFKIERLVTFVPSLPPPFRAHPAALLEAQAQAIDIPHSYVVIGEPYDKAYRSALRELAESGVKAVVTGDIDLVGGYPNWILQSAAGLDLQVIRPLWNRDRKEILKDLVDSGFKALITAANISLVPQADLLLGKTISHELIKTLEELKPKIDICGENGEYHTMVWDGPIFARPVSLQAFTSASEVSNTLKYLKFAKR